MRRVWFVLALSTVFMLALVPLAEAVTYTVTNISQRDNGYDLEPQINNVGEVVWYGSDEILHPDDDEIYLFDPTDESVTNISQTVGISDDAPQINDAGQVVWQGGGDWDDAEIHLFDPADETVTKISEASGADNNMDPQINDSGMVVWEGYDRTEKTYDIYLFDGTTVTNISDITGVVGRAPQINDAGQVVWQGGSCCWVPGIYLFNPTTQTVTNISEATGVGSAASPQINDSGMVVWQGQAPPYEIFLYDPTDETVTNISQTAGAKGNLRLNNAGEVVWYGRDGDDFEIYFFDPASETVTNISQNDSWDVNPEINNSGQVVWERSDEIFLFDPSDKTVTNISQSPENDYDGHPRISDSGEVVWEERTGSNYEVFLATPLPEIDDVLTAFDEAVLSGDLQGSGTGPWAALRLEALRNVLLQAQSLANAGATGGACARLDFAYRRIDGDPKPPDLATGPAAPEIAEMIQSVRDGLGCS